MLHELSINSEPLIRGYELSHGDLRILGTEPVTRANDTMVVLWEYPDLGKFELTTDYGNVWFSRDVGTWFNKRGEKGVDRIARFSYRYGSIEATNRLQLLLNKVQSRLDSIQIPEASEPISRPRTHHPFLIPLP